MPVLELDLSQFRNFYLNKKACFQKAIFRSPNDELNVFLETIKNPINYYGETGIALIKDGVKIQHEAWTHNVVDYGQQVDINALFKAISLGASVILNDYYRWSAFTRKTIKWLENEFNCISSCNAYLSQTDNFCFNPHRDCHDVFVVAISGQKKWTIYKNKQPYNDAYNKHPAQECVTQNLSIESVNVMDPGDILYIPMGQFHSVENHKDNSLHLTFSLKFAPIYKLLQDVFELMQLPSEQITSLPVLRNVASMLHPSSGKTLGATKEEIKIGIANLIEVLIELAENENFFLSQKRLPRNIYVDICDPAIIK